jgi:ribosome-associated toxin RatA of RatAB toxin-antitoxin module
MTVALGTARAPRASSAGQEPALQLSVGEEAGVYTVAARFDAPGAADSVVAVLTDYERIPQFMPGVKTSIVRERADDRVLVEQEALSTFLLFSKHVHLLLEVRQEGHRIRFRDLAGDSFTRYEGRWQVREECGRTLVSYELTAVPAFAVPAPLLRRLLTRDSAQMVTQLRREIARRAGQTSLTGSPERSSRGLSN